MAGRHSFPSGNPKSRSPILLFLIAVLALSILFYIFSVFSSPSHTTPIHDFQISKLNPKVEYSFVASIEEFLASTSKNQRSHTVSDDTVHKVSKEDVTKLDDLMSKREAERLFEQSFYPAFSPLAPSALRVYVYEMPSKFTHDLLWLFRNTYRETSNLTSNGSPIHRLIEQHSIDYWLWADLITPESERLLKSVMRVYRQEEADLFYIPFFTTISFFLLEKQQCKSLYRVKL